MTFWCLGYSRLLVSVILSLTGYVHIWLAGHSRFCVMAAYLVRRSSSSWLCFRLDTVSSMWSRSLTSSPVMDVNVILSSLNNTKMTSRFRSAFGCVYCPPRPLNDDEQLETERPEDSVNNGLEPGGSLPISLSLNAIWLYGSCHVRVNGDGSGRGLDSTVGWI